MSNQGAFFRAGLSAVFLASVLLACGGDGTGPGEKVASVVITGVPTTAFLVGDSVRLVAQPVSATGGLLSGQAIQWKSSAPAVAAVRANGTVLALASGQAVISASAGGAAGTATLDVSDGDTIGTQGGTLTAAGGAVKLVVPPGTLTQPTLLVVSVANGAPADGRIVPNAVWQLGPDGTSFRQYATLTLRYDAAQVPSGLAPRSLQLYTVSAGNWTLIPGSTVDTAAKTVTGSIGGPGTYGLRSTPVDHIQLGGAAAGGALYTGQTSQLAATLYGSNGDTLPSRTLTWSSSNAGSVSVDANGKVTGVAVGSATITVATDGKSASTAVQVLVRPTADWSRVGEWTTFQGNAAHTGYVDATLDPVVFKPAWTGSVGTGTLNPVTASDGKVFVSTQEFFGTERLFTLDAGSGSILWSHDFGGIASVDPPAYAGGTVYVQTGGQQDSYLYAFEAATGQQRFRSAYSSQFESYFAPVIVGQTIFMAGGHFGGMYAFSTVDGAQRWFAGTAFYDEWTPAVAAGRVYAYTGQYSRSVTVVDAVAGSVLDSIADPNFSPTGSMNIAPVLGGANDLLATQGGRLLSFDLADHGIRYELKASYYGTVAVAAGVLYVLNNNALEARNESDGSLLWTWAPPSGKPTQPAIVTNNLLFVTTGSVTYALDLAAHRAVWSYPAGGPLALSSRGQLLIAGGDGKVTAIAVK